MSRKPIVPVPALPALKLIWSCHFCGTKLPLWKMKCPNCKNSTMSWLHFGVIAVVGLLVAYYLLKRFI